MIKNLRAFTQWQWVLSFFFVLLLLWAVCPLFYVPHQPTGIMVFIVLLCILALYLTANPRLISAVYIFFWKHTAGRILLIVFHAVLLSILIAAIVFTGLMISANEGEPDPDTPLLICGARVTEDGPAPILVERLEAAYEYLEDNPGALCVVTGGQGGDEPMPEGEVMARYLTEKGIAPERILVENESVNTEENIKLGSEILRVKGGYQGASLAIGTDSIHQYRAQWNARKLGFEPSAVSAPTPFFQVFNHWVRELMANVKTVIFDPA